jgi:protection-of-telomeres protein 1
VVDFSPNKLEDFARSLADPNYNDIDGEPTVHQRDVWEWAFWLLLEEPRAPPGKPLERMKVLVSGTDAEFLLNLSPMK